MGVRSEYQKHFKVSALRKSLPNYYENVAFRTARRDREYAHTPLSWNDEEDTESVETDSGEDVEIKRDGQENTTDEVGKKPSEEQLQLRLEEDSQKVSNELEDNNVPETGSQKTSCIESGICKEKENKKCDKQSPQKGAYNKTFVIKQGKQRRPDRKQKIPTRPTSSKLSPRRAGSRGKTSHPVEHPAPFLSYGWGDVERDLSQHKTFNVRASADVYPAAIRALSRRKTAAERRSETVKKSAEDKVKALLDAAALKRVDQGSEWKSEYQQRYPAYDESEYIRNVSARSNDRKLCRVVYVS